jgi:SHS2 domain-containing protein
MPLPFELIEHPADVGFMAYGTDLTELFQNAGLAMMSLACPPETVDEREHRTIKVEAATLEDLLYAWLAEILAVADAEQLVLSRAAIATLNLHSDSPSRFEAEGVVFGQKFDRERHPAGTYIKAVTYHQFAVEKIAAGWRARVFLDL